MATTAMQRATHCEQRLGFEVSPLQVVGVLLGQRPQGQCRPLRQARLLPGDIVLIFHISILWLKMKRLVEKPCVCRATKHFRPLKRWWKGSEKVPESCCNSGTDCVES